MDQMLPISHVVVTTLGRHTVMSYLIYLPPSMFSAEGRPTLLVDKQKPGMTQPQLDVP